MFGRESFTGYFYWAGIKEEKIMKGHVKRTHIFGKGKWLLSLLISLSLAAVALPGQARAETTGGLCPHHTEHTEDCGYAEAVDAKECMHVHDENCGYVEANECGHEHDEDCGYAEASECVHVHDEDCGYAETGECGHEHDANCGYAEGKEGSPCNYVCRICPVQELIDGLPEADEITEENMEAAAAQLTAVDKAKEELTDKAMAAASREDYPIYVAGVRVTSLNADNVLEGDPENDGKVKYDPDTQTLTLDGVNIVYTSSYDANAIRTVNNTTGRTDLTIELLNENRIVSETSCSGRDEGKRRVIDACDDLTFTGSGSLEITGTASTAGPIITIQAGSALRFENTTVTAIAGDCPSESGDFDRSWAICGESVQITGGKVTAVSGWATDAGSSTGITTGWGDIVISDNAEVVARAGRGESSYALSTDEAISISNSKVSALGGDALYASYGIGAGSLTISNSEVDAQAGAGESGWDKRNYLCAKLYK